MQKSCCRKAKLKSTPHLKSTEQRTDILIYNLATFQTHPSLSFQNDVINLTGTLKQIATPETGTGFNRKDSFRAA